MSGVAKPAARASSFWKATTLRMTAFPSADPPLAELTWWRDLVGSSPDESTTKDRGSVLHQVGTFREAKLILQIQPGRINWALTAADSDSSSEDGIPNLDDLPSAAEALSDVCSGWFRIAPPLRRLAFGAELLRNVADRAEAYSLLSRNLPGVQIDAAGSTDFLYRINRPRPTKTGVPDLTINRLSTWSAVLLQRLQVELGGITGTSAARPVGRGDHFCRLELDINTTAEFKSDLPSGSLKTIYDELVGSALEICEQGDVP